MSNIAVIEPSRLRLRSDLDSTRIEEGQRASRIVIDEVSGRFSRISERGWQQLCGRNADTLLWHQAYNAGWTRVRADVVTPYFSLLAIRIPLGSIDAVAKSMARFSGILFAPAAIVMWSLVIASALILALSRSTQWMHAAENLPLFLQSTNSLGIAVAFLVTKTIHELAHAVMCRRMGASSNSIGVFLFCGLPCPYCDVTDVWRLPSALGRAAVMLAGIYVELIIAAMATFVWCAANDPAIRMYAMNLMLVCGISTVLFNANPLMRYDGYYVLSDWLRSTNLRREARDCFQSVVVSRIAGRGYGRPRRYDRRAIGLSVYHVASLLYRTLVLVAIATLLMGVAAAMHLRFIAVVLVAMAAMAMILQQFKSSFNMLRGEGGWMNVHYSRRLAIAMSIVGLLAAILFVPVPRYRQVQGVVDSADAVSVFLPPDSQLDSVATEIGSQVQASQWIATLDSNMESIHLAQLQGELRLARLRSDLARRRSLNRPEVASQWTTLQAAEKSVEMLLDAAGKRLDEAVVRSPISGTVVPPSPQSSQENSGKSIWLAGQVGTVINSRDPWCRISPDGARHAIFRIDARDHELVTAGTHVRIHLDDGSSQVVSSNIESVSAIHADLQSITREANYQILCPLPAVAIDEMMDSIGIPCSGVIRLPSRAIGADFAKWIGEFVSGRI
ncbi:multidrug efflux system subunit MdtA [Novipirellula galeiformis]|uniref:Multidrug efflux system subunit MdtA n=1 Tax=Novipirellula galeiformis TaxID=2528004 RepID=A0A5C6CIH5_9BACT|nr:hypothetical protein [Novipirellula galeiformis]TWU24400.1 multidrug efflux system subunit MdtA [Novipirellula galeiformis]